VYFTQTLQLQGFAAPKMEKRRCTHGVCKW